jgi:uncharacterized membrane protein
MKNFSVRGMGGKVAQLAAVSATALVVPALVFAQQPITNITGLVGRISEIVNIVLPFLIGLGVLAIIYGVLTYIFNAANEEKRKEARIFVIYGIVGVFVMLSVWGLVNILTNSFATDTDFLRRGQQTRERTKIPVPDANTNF